MDSDSNFSDDEESEITLKELKHINTLSLERVVLKPEESLAGPSTASLLGPSTSNLQSITHSPLTISSRLFHSIPTAENTSFSDTSSPNSSTGTPNHSAPSSPIRTNPGFAALSESPSKPSNFNAMTKLEQVNVYENGLTMLKKMEANCRKLEKALIGRLCECRKKIKEIHLPEITKKKPFSYIYCGKPYFKDRNNVPAPCNEDTIHMRKQQMFDFSSIGSISGWTDNDKSKFIAVVSKMSQDMKVKELNSQITEILKEARNKDIKSGIIDIEVENLQKEILAVSNKDLNELALPINEEYDWETIANLLHRRHSPQEYRSLWKLFLHPTINKDKWSETEHVNLLRIARDNNFQDWDKIALELNTRRTGYQCFVSYRTKMGSDNPRQKWTKEEEEHLKRVIEYYQEGDYIPWGKVAASMKNRTKISIYNKCLRFEEKRKGRFVPEEDAVILTCVGDFGTNFRRMKRHLPGRSATQIRNRYHIIKKTGISTVWTVEEDKRLIQLMANQDEITNYSSVVKFFPGKDRVHLRARHLTLVKWMRKHPNLDIDYAPRRGARHLGHGKASTNLDKAIKNLNNRICSNYNKIKSKTITPDSPEQDIDNAIVACLTTEALNDQAQSSSDDEEQSNSDSQMALNPTNFNKSNIQKLLILLRSRLNEKRFVRSDDYNKYVGFDNSENVSFIQMKSYSRKKTVETIKIQLPDIYGYKRLPQSTYVLPPHFSTITASQIFMKYANGSDSKIPLLHTLEKKNMIFKEQMSLLLERFNLLFLWPLLLTNKNATSPNNGIIQNMQGSSQMQYKITVDHHDIEITPGSSISKCGEEADGLAIKFQDSMSQNDDSNLESDDKEKITLIKNDYMNS